ncbi:MAG TPA: SGNH/GDSL hydrolase family protein [Mycobacteriales bacterium]|jgi:hypothetical protein|nr:SGNH/GDSL hydrolase family protein [Mycobacteriales bacterium]
MNLREYLSEAVWTREAVDRFLDAGHPNWATFDPVTGYRLHDIVMRDGIDGCATLNTYKPNTARTTIHYADQPCRINTYGDSFTQCHQVSDGETWQEILAAHFGEPIRNFGVGGHGVYQAYRRMRQIEATPDAASHIVLNIFDDDHIRNLDQARWFRLEEFRRDIGELIRVMFHANPWAHVRLDPASGVFVEWENPFPTPESLYQLCDPDVVYERFARDEVVRLHCLANGIDIGETAELRHLADRLGVAVDLASPNGAASLLSAYGLQATLFTLGLVRDYADSTGRKLIVLLSYGGEQVRSVLDGGTRADQPLLAHLDVLGIPYVDALAAHVRDAAAFRLDARDYTDRYYNRHYNPLGNHFFAFAAKPALLSWLDPKPPTYRDSTVTPIR